MKHAAIAADFVTWKHVPSRKVYQLVLEIPQERAPQVADALGWPDPATGCPVAVARLQVPEPGPGSAAGAGDERDVGSRADGLSPGDVVCDAPPTGQPAVGGSPAPRRRWDELPPAQQAGIRPNEPAFQAFAGAPKLWLYTPNAVAHAAAFIRQRCGVISRAELNTNPDAAARWRALDAEYQADTGRIAEQRA